jgi:hypothetical protein
VASLRIGVVEPVGPHEDQERSRPAREVGMSVVVSGATGNIGSALLRALEACGTSCTASPVARRRSRRPPCVGAGWT